MTFTTYEHSIMHAYANGALDGYNCSENNNPYDAGSPQLLSYNLGNAYGVMLEKQDSLYD